MVSPDLLRTDYSRAALPEVASADECPAQSLGNIELDANDFAATTDDEDIFCLNLPYSTGTFAHSRLIPTLSINAGVLGSWEGRTANGTRQCFSLKDSSGNYKAALGSKVHWSVRVTVYGEEWEDSQCFLEQDSYELVSGDVTINRPQDRCADVRALASFDQEPHVVYDESEDKVTFSVGASTTVNATFLDGRDPTAAIEMWINGQQIPSVSGVGSTSFSGRFSIQDADRGKPWEAAALLYAEKQYYDTNPDLRPYQRCKVVSYYTGINDKAVVNIPCKAGTQPLAGGGCGPVPTCPSGTSPQAPNYCTPTHPIPQQDPPGSGCYTGKCVDNLGNVQPLGCDVCKNSGGFLCNGNTCSSSNSTACLDCNRPQATCKASGLVEFRSLGTDGKPDGCADPADVISFRCTEGAGHRARCTWTCLKNLTNRVDCEAQRCDAGYVVSGGQCVPATSCQTAADCADDSNACTTKACDSGTCRQVPNTDKCTTVNDKPGTCDGKDTAICVPDCQSAADCDDNNGCTTDSCSPLTGRCHNTPNSNACTAGPGKQGVCTNSRCEERLTCSMKCADIGTGKTTSCSGKVPLGLCDDSTNGTVRCTEYCNVAVPPAATCGFRDSPYATDTIRNAPHEQLCPDGYLKTARSYAPVAGNKLLASWSCGPSPTTANSNGITHCNASQCAQGHAPQGDSCVRVQTSATTVVAGHVQEDASTPVPISGATVSGEGVSYVTDQHGGFVLSGVPIGKFIIKASKNGYAEASVEVTTVAKAAGEVNDVGLIRLRKTTTTTTTNCRPDVACAPGTSPTDVGHTCNATAKTETARWKCGTEQCGPETKTVTCNGTLSSGTNGRCNCALNNGETCENNNQCASQNCSANKCAPARQCTPNNAASIAACPDPGVCKVKACSSTGACTPTNAPNTASCMTSTGAAGTCNGSGACVANTCTPACTGKQFCDATQCKDCTGNTIPSGDRKTCVACPANAKPNASGTQCVCEAGYEDKDSGSAVRCEAVCSHTSERPNGCSCEFDSRTCASDFCNADGKCALPPANQCHYYPRPSGCGCQSDQDCADPLVCGQGVCRTTPTAPTAPPTPPLPPTACTAANAAEKCGANGVCNEYESTCYSCPSGWRPDRLLNICRPSS